MADDALDSIRLCLRQFAADRDWEQFHSPKNLTMALSVEAAELMEHFQWLSDDASRQLPVSTRDEVADEMADVLLYLVRLADVLGVDLASAAAAKMLKNAAKYPAEKVRGKADKYSKY
jgi:dCTP diphosphatase